MQHLAGAEAGLTLQTPEQGTLGSARSLVHGKGSCSLLHPLQRQSSLPQAAAGWDARGKHVLKALSLQELLQHGHGKLPLGEQPAWPGRGP